jgi:very-short-patch-repair endonuclease
MDPKNVQSLAAKAWALAERQHGVVARKQLIAIGLGGDAIRHRLEKGRLHRTRWRGVYAVGRPQLTRYGTWMAAVLACGDGAVLSHRTAAALWEIRAERSGEFFVSLPDERRPRRPGIRVYRRARLDPAEVTRHHRIPVTTPARTLIDLATCSGRQALETAVVEADKRELIDPEALRTALDQRRGEPGVGILRELLDRQTFTLTDSELERRFLPLTRRAGLPAPLTQQWVSGFRVDFYWPDLALVVETDGLRYHRTAAQQAKDRRRDQAHTAAGLTQLRFSHAQVASDPDHVVATLVGVSRRIVAAGER